MPIMPRFPRKISNVIVVESGPAGRSVEAVGTLRANAPAEIVGRIAAVAFDQGQRAGKGAIPGTMQRHVPPAAIEPALAPGG